MKLLQTIAGMLAVSTLLCAGNLCINASKIDGTIPYLSVTVTFLIEVFKLLLCIVAIVVTKTPMPTTLTYEEAGFYAVPSFLYMVDNNLTYIILRFVDPATLSVLWNLKILTTAVLFRFVLKRKLSEIRKIAIVLLLLGVVTSQSDHLKKETETISTVHTTTSNNTTTVSPAAAMGDMQPSLEAQSPQDFMFGIILVLIAVTISSCASVFTEWAFKRKGSCSFLWQNAQLYVFGILFNGVGLLVEGGEINDKGFFSGYNGWTYAVILVNCVAGISMGFILKYMDNIACVYSHAIAMMLTMLFSMVFFNFSPSLEFGCGLSVLLISMYLYHHKVDTSMDMELSSHCHSTDEDDAKATVDPKLMINGTPSVRASSIPASLGAGLHHKKDYEQVPPDEMDLERQ